MTPCLVPSAKLSSVCVCVSASTPPSPVLFLLPLCFLARLPEFTLTKFFNNTDAFKHLHAGSCFGSLQRCVN